MLTGPNLVTDVWKCLFIWWFWSHNCK